MERQTLNPAVDRVVTRLTQPLAQRVAAALDENFVVGADDEIRAVTAVAEERLPADRHAWMIVFGPLEQGRHIAFRGARADRQ